MSSDVSEGWQTVPVRDALARRRGRAVRKLQTSEYLPSGTLPIVDQGAKFVCGFTDDLAATYPYELPVIVFGDHTRALKYVDFPFAIGADGTQCLHPREEFDPRFFFYALQVLDLRGEGYARHFKLLKEQVIPAPPLDEQRQIAEVLRSVDEAFEFSSRAILQARAVHALEAQSAFREVGAGTLSSTSASNGWRRVLLGQVFNERRDQGRRGLPVASVSIEQGVVLRSSLDRRVQSDLPPEGHALVLKDDIAYNMMRMWQGACGLAQKDCIISPAYVVMTPTSDIDPLFAFHMLRSQPVIRLLHGYSQGIVDDRLRLYPKAFAQIPVNLPPLAIQREIAASFEALADFVAAAERQHVALASLRRAITDDLLSGRVRVPA